GGAVRVRHHGAHPGQGRDRARPAPRPTLGRGAPRGRLPGAVRLDFALCRAQGRRPRGARARRGRGSGSAPVHRLSVPVRGDVILAARGHRRGADAGEAKGLARTMVPESYYVGLSAILFSLGVLGVLVRRNPLVIFMSIEMMLNAAN